MKKKKLPIGLSDFKRLMEDNYYYVDKSIFIQEIIDHGGIVTLIPRPRRFGKTLNLSMLRHFFEKKEKDTSYLFKDLNIWKAGEEYREKQGKFPVIYLTFKDVKDNNWKSCFESIKSIINELYGYHNYLTESKLLKDFEKEEFYSILSNKADESVYSLSLKKLSSYLEKYHNQKIILLIDEYDTPMQSGYTYKYYDDVINFMRKFLSAGLKDNESIEKGVLTGILRIAKESIFTGMNNLGVYTVLDDKFSDKFGFTDDEVSELLNYFHSEYNIVETRNWYNGYIFGETIIYNPWSILNFIDRPKGGFTPYWVNTSSNDLVKDLLSRSSNAVKLDLELLITGNSIRKEIRTDIVFGEIEKSSETLWSFLLFCGYLKVLKKEYVNKKLVCELQIPNKEVEYLYESIILQWFERSIQNDKLEMMLKSLTNGDIKTFGKILQEFVINSMSYLDPTGIESEKVYHAFVLGLLLSLHQSYEIKSNRESGLGRYDVMLIPKDVTKKGIVMEFKKVDHDDKETIDDTIKLALAQIEEKKYEAELIEKGVADILKLGIAFDGKVVKVGVG